MSRNLIDVYQESSNVSLKLFYTNADQFLNKREDLLMMIAGDEPDVILITEVIPKSQFHPIDPALLHIKHYRSHFNFEPNTRNLGASGIRGVAIYWKENLGATKVDIPCADFHDHAWIEIPTSTKPLLIGCIYRSPREDKDNARCLESSKKVSRLIKTAVENNNNIVLAGDFNYKDIDWSCDYAPPDKLHLSHFLKTLQECFLLQHVTEPTRFREYETPSLLDLVLSSEEGLVNNLEYLPPLGESDHISLRFNIPLSPQIRRHQHRNSIDIRKTDYEAFKLALRSHNWTEELNSSFEADYDYFLQILLSQIEMSSPKKVSPKSKRNLYMTNEALRLKSSKQKLWRRYLTTKTIFDHDKYKRCKNQLRHLTRKLRRDFERNIALKTKTAPKSFWRYTKSRLKPKVNISTLTKPDGSKATTAKEKAKLLNEFFSSVFTIENLQSIPPPPRQPSHIDYPLTDIEITPDVVKTKLKALNPNKTAGHDNCHPFSLIELSEEICEPLSILYKNSLKEGAHKSWIKGVITAIHKKD